MRKSRHLPVGDTRRLAISRRVIFLGFSPLIPAVWWALWPVWPYRWGRREFEYLRHHQRRRMDREQRLRPSPPSLLGRLANGQRGRGGSGGGRLSSGGRAGSSGSSLGKEERSNRRREGPSRTPAKPGQRAETAMRCPMGVRKAGLPRRTGGTGARGKRVAVEQEREQQWRREGL